MRHTYPLGPDGKPLHEGTYRKYHRVLYVGDDVHEAGDLQIIIMHELGHSAGMEHLAPGLYGIMMADDRAPDWTENDLNECRRVDACD